MTESQLSILCPHYSSQIWFTDSVTTNASRCRHKTKKAAIAEFKYVALSLLRMKPGIYWIFINAQCFAAVCKVTLLYSCFKLAETQGYQVTNKVRVKEKPEYRVLMTNSSLRYSLSSVPSAQFRHKSYIIK